MNNIVKLEFPVSFDSLNDAIVDAKGRTLCLFSWPQCGLDVLTVKERAMLFVNRVNEVVEMRSNVQSVLNVHNVVNESKNITNGVNSLINKIFGKKKVFKKAKNYKWVDVNGKDVALRGRPWHGEKKVYLDNMVIK